MNPNQNKIPENYWSIQRVPFYYKVGVKFRETKTKLRDVGLFQGKLKVRTMSVGTKVILPQLIGGVLFYYIFLRN